MNLDILADNPHWWWYVILAVGTIAVTISVWIVFKRYGGLEDRLERSFNWLVQSQKIDDVEAGWSQVKKVKFN
ncbi:hypothetical protein T440DRAFT_469051 [Plenodomus tracheiphilus IPT5]|uniref:Uncharacterized protein n=1 Tax=Plenodomus tracheiphilus IPT5 TaxID=1408161 RepID=A0A6A7B4M2_9PLEO|nr:hypothetical protein T440DRAFT_469051 [Plenodomus tracheiphilus IPT5]